MHLLYSENYRCHFLLFIFKYFICLNLVLPCISDDPWPSYSPVSWKIPEQNRFNFVHYYKASPIFKTMSEEKVLILYASNYYTSKQLNIPAYLPVPFKNWIFFAWEVHFVGGCVKSLHLAKNYFRSILELLHAFYGRLSMCFVI